MSSLVNIATHSIDHLDWAAIAHQLDEEGYALLPNLLTTEQIEMLTALFNQPDAGRNLSLSTLELGQGELLQLNESLPALLSTWCTRFYHYLEPIANHWQAVLDLVYRYPPEWHLFLQQNQRIGQTQSQSHLSRLQTSGYLALHQHNDGELVFPLQVIALLTEPGRDFQGGEFIMTEQRPRRQSRPMVLPLKRGNAAIISTAQRPVKGTKGYYRANLKHAISRVRSGQRDGLELLFHHAPQPQSDQST